MSLTERIRPDSRFGRLWWGMEAKKTNRIKTITLFMEVIDNLLCIESDTLLSRVCLCRSETDDRAFFTESFAILIGRWGEVLIGVRETEEGEHREYSERIWLSYFFFLLHCKYLYFFIVDDVYYIEYAFIFIKDSIFRFFLSCFLINKIYFSSYF